MNTDEIVILLNQVFKTEQELQTKIVSNKTLCELIGFDYKDEKRKMLEELKVV